jgi:predicted transcriptional regulator
MKVRDVMTKDVVSVSPEVKIVEVARILFENRFHGVPVVEDGKIIGIITEDDFFTKDSKNLFLPSYINFLQETGISSALTREKQEKLDKLMNSKASDIMSSDCVTIMDSMDIRDLLNFFRETNFNTLPVTDEKNSLVGIVTLADILGLVKPQEK